MPGCGSPLLRDRKAAAVIYPPLLPNPIKWRSSGPGRRGAREPGGGGGKDGAKEGRTNGPAEGGGFGFIYSRGFLFFSFFIFYGGLVSFPRLSRAAFKPDVWPAGVWTGGQLGRPCRTRLPKGPGRPCLGDRGPEEEMRAGKAPTSLHRGKDTRGKPRGFHESTSWRVCLCQLW